MFSLLLRGKNLCLNGVVFFFLLFSSATCRKKIDSTTMRDHEGEIYCSACHGKQFGPKGYGFAGGAGTMLSMDTGKPFQVTRECVLSHNHAFKVFILIIYFDGCTLCFAVQKCTTHGTSVRGAASQWRRCAQNAKDWRRRHLRSMWKDRISCREEAGRWTG